MEIYDRNKTAQCIDGYFFPRPGEALEKTFQRAKDELLVHLKKNIKFIEDMDYEQFRIGMEDSGEFEKEF